MTIRHDYRSARASWRALAAALAAASLTVPALAQEAAPAAQAAARTMGVPAWGIASPDLEADPTVRFGRLDNGMRYAIQQHEMPQDGASIRFGFDVGMREEGNEEVGAAHFVEHMAFNGSTNIPEGELMPRLERLGLAFGADTNAETGIEHTTYKLDLPKTDPATIDAALAIVREVASEMTIAPEAVERERGIILSEYQARNVPQRRRAGELLTALLPGNRIGARVNAPPEAIGSISAAELQAFYRGYYRPERATLVIVGDFDPAEMEAKIERVFADWQGTGEARESYAPPVPSPAEPRIATFVDPSIPEFIEIHHVSTYRPALNTVADQRRSLLETVATLALNNRLAALTRDSTSPILGGQAAFQELARSAESAGLMVVAKDGQWRPALALAEQELRRAHEHGFTGDEIAEAKANFEAALTNAAAQAAGWRSEALAEMLTAVSLNDTVPLSPAGQLALYRAVAETITSATVGEAFRAAWPGRPTVVHVSTKTPVEEAVIAAALAESTQVAVAPPGEAAAAAFAYDDFGPPGEVVSDSRIADLGIRTIAFANGTRLNLRKSDTEPGSVGFLMLVGDGARAFPRDKAGLQVLLQNAIPADGLAAHAPDELRRLMAGRQVSLGLSAGDEALQSSGVTTAADLELQLKLLAARVTATAYRPETQAQWAATAPVLVKNVASNPMAMLAMALNFEIAGRDGRAGFADPSVLEKVSLQDLRAAIEPQLSAGPIELGLVGDFDEDAAIAAFARTLGALPPRPAPTGSAAGEPFVFAQDRTPRTIHHAGAADQGMLAMSWPATDGRDLRSALTRDLLAAVLQLRLIETLREELGAVYTPQTISHAPLVPEGFGHLTAMVPAAPDKADLIARAMKEVAAELREQPVPDDLILRARQPILEQYRQQLRQNAAWAGIVAMAQSKPELLERHRRRSEAMESLTPADLQAAAREFLDEEPLLIRVMPKG